MIFEETFVVRAPIRAVWDFLRDPGRVAGCVPGAEKVDVIDDRTYHVVAGARVAFLSVSFALKVVVTEIEEPSRLVSVAEGMDARLKERVKLGAELRLRELDPSKTEVSYRIDLTVFGKLAALGLTAIKGKARQTAADFAANIRRTLETTA